MIHVVQVSTRDVFLPKPFRVLFMLLFLAAVSKIDWKRCTTVDLKIALRDPGAYFLKNRVPRGSAGAYFLKISDPRELIFRKISPALRAGSYF